MASLTAAGWFDAFLVRMDAAGEFRWARGFGGSSHTTGALGVALAPAGDIVVAGHFTGTVDFDPGPAVFSLQSAGGTDLVLWRLDGNGNLRIARRAGGPGDDRGQAVAADAAGWLYVTGFFSQTVAVDTGSHVIDLDEQRQQGRARGENRARLRRRGRQHVPQPRRLLGPWVCGSSCG